MKNNSYKWWLVAFVVLGLLSGLGCGDKIVIIKQRSHYDVVDEITKPILDSLQNENRIMDRRYYELTQLEKCRYQVNIDASLLIGKIRLETIYKK